MFPDSRDTFLCAAHSYTSAAHVFTCGTTGIAVPPGVVACDTPVFAAAPNSFAVNANATLITAHTDAVAPFVNAVGRAHSQTMQLCSRLLPTRLLPRQLQMQTTRMYTYPALLYPHPATAYLHTLRLYSRSVPLHLLLSQHRLRQPPHGLRPLRLQLYAHHMGLCLHQRKHIQPVRNCKSGILCPILSGRCPTLSDLVRIFAFPTRRFPLLGHDNNAAIPQASSFSSS